MIPDCNCCWCCKYAHGKTCDEWCNDEFEMLCECSELEYRPLIEEKLANDDCR